MINYMNHFLVFTFFFLKAEKAQESELYNGREKKCKEMQEDDGEKIYIRMYGMEQLNGKSR